MKLLYRAVAAFTALAVLGMCGACTAADGHGADKAKPLASAFDNTAVSADEKPETADFDGSGHSLSATDLDDVGWKRGTRVTVSGTGFSLADVAPGRPDNVLADGQTITLSGSGSAVSFLATSTGGPVTGTGTVHYTDGSNSGYTITADDWMSGDPAAAAVTLPHVNSASGAQANPVRLFAVSAPVTRDKTVSGVTLPRVGGSLKAGKPSMHIFAVNVRDTTGAPDGRSWTGSWSAAVGAAQTVPQPGGWTDQSLRLVVHPDLAGTTARFRLTNVFSPVAVTFGHVTVADQADGAKAERAPVSLTFDGQQQTTVPAGADVFSDPVPFPVTPQDNLLVSIYLPGSVLVAPLHTYALTTSFTTGSGKGDHTADPAPAAYTGKLDYWAFLSGVDVMTDRSADTLVALGDSQTDGGRSTPNTNHRWPDFYAADLRTASSRTGVVNAGISSNRVLKRVSDDGGVSALSRLDRDVLAQPNARTLVLYEGINDINSDASAADIEAGLRRISATAQAYGLRVVVATIPPFGDHVLYTDAREDVRQSVNNYLRSSSDFDQCVDLDLASRDPQAPTRLRHGYVAADGLHFNDLGTKLVADTLALAAASVPSSVARIATGRTPTPG